MRLLPVHNRSLFIALVTLFLFNPCLANTYYLPSTGEQVVGELKTVTVNAGVLIEQIARDYGVGYNALLAANPALVLPINNTTTLTIPTQHILPNTPYEGIVINLPEMRLYYYPPVPEGQRPVVSTYAIGIGREGFSIPPLISHITSKRVDPSWRVPDALIEEYEAQGKQIAEEVPPGPNNPLGKYAMRLDDSAYLIHGTNNPFSIGKRSSRGCIRMYPEDIEFLFPFVPSGTTVRVIHQPIKSGWRGNTLYIESHAPLSSDEAPPNTPDTVMNEFFTIPDLELDAATRSKMMIIKQRSLGIPEAAYTPDPALRNQ